MSRRIIYVLEDFPIPFGGAAAIYRHVEILNAHGFSAYVALPGKPKTNFYETTAPLLIQSGGLQTMVGDVWVIPEGYPDLFRALMSSPVKRLMYCQNQYYVPFPNTVGSDVHELGAHGIIGCSEAVRHFFKNIYGMADVPILPCAVDPARFAPAQTKRRQIAFMPRKLPQEAAFIAATFKRRYPQFRDVPWVPIQGVSQREAARVMGESALFLSLSHKESFGLPPLEAMACACLVSGFHGDGGREYMNDANGWWAETGDWKACCDGLAAGLQLLDQGGPELDARRRAMAETVERYSPNRLESALVAFWRQELSKPFP